MQSLRLASRRLANSAIRPSLRLSTPRQALRRNYASSSGGHGSTKSNEITWALAAVAVTVPGLYLALKPSADSGHGSGHGHGHDSHDAHEEKKVGEEEAEHEEESGKGEGKVEAKSDEDAKDGDDKEEKDEDKEEDKSEGGDDKEEKKDVKDDSEKKSDEEPVSHAKHTRQNDPNLGKKPSGLLATSKEKKGGDDRL